MSAAHEFAGHHISADELGPAHLTRCIAAVARPGAGAVVTFLGTVRDVAEGKQVTALEYHAYESMAERQMAEVLRSVEADFPEVRVAAVHRVGTLRVSDVAVVCAASAPHRDEAFSACRAVIDRVKQRVPIWKREHGPSGPAWVTGRP